MITEESDEEFVCMEIVSDKDKWYEVKVDISGKEVLLKVDSGAQCNVMGLQQYLDLDLVPDCTSLPCLGSLYSPVSTQVLEME